ncbi:hypothetical protein DTL42_00925 [Bremerella cremea]|uniref:SLA1 homology domain-containing protein n=1 Tax=Bremerella cremea TaxID=1031537 RepID=A0A368KZQ0_9BACT|nr:SHD1 domain-containing protein [Bremerella cremea]RCS55984.1 hypothetical protein DTL42_00925 [Bremerella cremea]
MTWARSSLGLVCLFSLVMLGGLSRLALADDFRTWVDKTGKFKIEATLHELRDGKVILHTKDKREITVPLTLLSDDDQTFVSQKEINPFGGGKPIASPAAMPAESTNSSRTSRRSSPRSSTSAAGLLAKDAAVTELPTDGTELFISIDQELEEIAADPLPEQAKFRQMVVPLEKLDAYAKISAPVVVDPAKLTFAVSTNRVANASSPDHFGRIYLAVAGKSRPVVALDLPETLQLLDHHIATNRSLVMIGVGATTERGGDLVLLEGLSTGDPKPLARWHLPEWEKPGFKPKVEFARLLDGTKAVVRVNSSLYIWDMLEGKCLFALDQLSGSGDLTLSGTGKYLAIPVSGGVRVVETATGELLGGVKIATTLTPEAHFSPDGKMLALVAGSQYRVWDLTKGRELSEGTVEGVPGKFYGWIGNDYLMTQLAGIIDPELGMTLWKYHLPSGTDTVPLSSGIAVIDKHGNQSTTLMTMRVPHAPVAKVKQKLSGDTSNLLLIKPGTEVALKIDAIAGVDQEMIKEGLTEAVERAGWVVNEKSPIELIAKIGRGEPIEMNYRRLGASFRSNGEVAKITPYTASLQVKDKSKVLWERKSENMVPRLLRLQPGQSIQEAVTEHEKPDPEFFKRLRLPPRVLKPEVSELVGRSRIKEGSWHDF